MLVENGLQNVGSMERVEINNQAYYKISHTEKLPHFFMTLISDSNHWMFIGSNGALTAGRKDAEHSLFPYYTHDKVMDMAEVTGDKTIIKIQEGEKSSIWEPFSIRHASDFKFQRNVYKNIYGNSIIFEEINIEKNIIFRYQWNSSNLFGFLRTGELINTSDKNYQIEIVDGIQNILPMNVGSELQNHYSNLVDAYKRSELVQNTQLGIFALSAVIVDRAEPSEALRANIAWNAGLDNSKILISSAQLDAFRSGAQLQEEYDNKGERGAYFVNNSFLLSANQSKKWYIVANVNHDHSDIIAINSQLEDGSLTIEQVLQDVKLGTQNLIKLCASADGVQQTADQLKDTRHFANVMFNIMRGGIFDDNYTVEKSDFINYLKKADRTAYQSVINQLDALADTCTNNELIALAQSTNNVDFIRLATEYLPLKFSRRHGDPSRPWNKFEINTINENDGTKILDYQGNWRDIFQNWETLAHSFPEFTEGMLFRFLNASTFEGYNPYRLTKDGFDWESIEEDDPWSYIGYWGDHQIIYLLKFLEFIEKYKPNALEQFFNKDLFVFANVPYRIKNYQEILKDPKSTIDFDYTLDEKLREESAKIGFEATLCKDTSGTIYHVNFIEKILTTVLAKMSNFIPEGGIWMNTQRPEWNDANNALVGNGVSMVTLYYLRRFMKFFDSILEKSSVDQVAISSELTTFFTGVASILHQNIHLTKNTINNQDRKKIVDGLGELASTFRWEIYTNDFSGNKNNLKLADIQSFIKDSIAFMDHCIVKNKREDKLYHAYNLVEISDNEMNVAYLSEMLEGQVGVLSSGLLSAQQSVEVLDSLRNSALYREDQNSYILYPNKQLSGFLQKNTISKEQYQNNPLVEELLEKGNVLIFKKDNKGQLHFNSGFKNNYELNKALDQLDTSKLQYYTPENRKAILDLYELIFNHKEFTGRSGTFFGYEGLGSIYWHMVSKLLLAVQETLIRAHENNESPELIKKLTSHYYHVNEGIGVHKSPENYGAFTTDPYSHTPFGRGAQQPGMTGQVKEDILCRFGELGIKLSNGSIQFDPFFLDHNEFSTVESEFTTYTLDQKKVVLSLPKQSIAFSICQVPVIFTKTDRNQIQVVYTDGTTSTIEGLSLSQEITNEICNRTGKVAKIITSLMN